jgi:hypothetical protein
VVNEVDYGVEARLTQVSESLIGVRPVEPTLPRLHPVPSHRIAQSTDALTIEESDIVAPPRVVLRGLEDVPVVRGQEGALESADDGQRPGRHAATRPRRVASVFSTMEIAEAIAMCMSRYW